MSILATLCVCEKLKWGLSTLQILFTMIKTVHETMVPHWLIAEIQTNLIAINPHHLEFNCTVNPAGTSIIFDWNNIISKLLSITVNGWIILENYLFKTPRKAQFWLMSTNWFKAVQTAFFDSKILFNLTPKNFTIVIFKETSIFLGIKFLVRIYWVKLSSQNFWLDNIHDGPNLWMSLI